MSKKNEEVYRCGSKLISKKGMEVDKIKAKSTQ